MFKERGDPSFKRFGRCVGVDPEIFFPNSGDEVSQAKAICAECYVKVECLEYALKNNEKFGIWGGLTERERRRIRRSGQIEKLKSSAQVLKKVPTR
ncbi:WhiB family transcriptional regulator [Candidatus Roizmanbacteria bacterium]|nr:WhiB family transcriptional regulator [Candidatus Roizmanbacteria bacterium]